MNTIQGINHIGIRIRDLTRTRAFYEQLGFAFVVGPVGPEPIAVMVHPCGVNLNLIINVNSERTDNVLMDAADKHAGYTHMALDVADIEQVLVALDEAGIAVSEGPVRFDGHAMVFVRDPDRNVVEFHMNPAAR